MSMSTLPDAAWHQALFYEGTEQYVQGVLGFIDAALAADRPVFAAVPADHGAVLRSRMNGQTTSVRFTDMSVLGRNPARIIPAIRAFVDEHPDRPVSFVGEPMWSGRTPAEAAEATRHEALINAAFAESAAHVLCPYDMVGLQSDILADAFRTHPVLVDPDGRQQASLRYTDPREVWTDTSHLPAPPANAHNLIATKATLRELREVIRRVSSLAALPEQRAEDLLLAVTELATNSVLHGGGSAAITIWADHGQVTCQVCDPGTIDDPLIGRRRPPLDSTNGRGLWLINQLCDLVQLHSTDQGTLVRITV